MLNNKILVIDDEQPVIHSIYRTILLEDDTYEILSANNGKEGLEIYYREEPILVVLDLKMPVMGGIEFLKNIHLTASDPSSAIVITGFSNNENIKKCFDLGISAFLRKPFNKYEFIGLVRHTIALKRLQLTLKESACGSTIRDHMLSGDSTLPSGVLESMKKAVEPILDNTDILLKNNMAYGPDRIEKLQTIKSASNDLLNIIKNAAVTNDA